MKKSIAKGLGMVGAISSLASGLFWYLSAENQLFLGGKLTPASTAVEKLTYLANTENFWAAGFAAVAGIAIGLAVFFDD